MDKTAIRNFAIEARKILMKSAITEAGFYGITKDGCKDPVQKGNDFEVYETVAGTENRIFGDDIKRRANLVQAIKTLGFEQVIEETAYTWFNRIIAIRFMEVNNYLPTRVRVLSSETGSGTPDIITQADTVELNLTLDELEKIQTAKRENRYDDAFRMLFIKQCNELNAILPGLFEKTDDYMELLLKITYTGDGVIRMLVDSIPEDNFNVETEGQVEIIGWMYQYYNTELKDDTFAKLKKNVKITKERIPAATQLFTPDWIVRYMVENSLGRVWIEHLRAANPSVDEKAKAEEFGWKYYLPEAEQDDDVQAQLVEIRKSYKELTPQDITCIDPCMGSGHILVYMFDVLMDIYRSEGFSEREAVFDILEKNIRGLDIDRRAYQLSYFALMMKARGYNRIFFRGHEDAEGNRVQAIPRVYAIEESNSIDRTQLKYFGAGLDELSKNNALNQMNGLLDVLHDAREYGSIVHVEKYDWALLRSFVENVEEEGQASLFGFMAYQSKSSLEKLIEIGKVLSTEYYAVITNPPYRAVGDCSDKLNEYIKTNFNDSKSDLSTVFMEHSCHVAKTNGYIAMINIPVWMFQSSFLNLRKKLLKNITITSMVHPGRGIFGSDFGTVAFVFCHNNIPAYKAEYRRLFDKQGEVKSNDERERAFLSGKGKYTAVQENYEKLDGLSISYWATENAYRICSTEKKLKDIGDAKQGLATGDNGRFMRSWYEIAFDRIAFGIKSTEEAASSGYKWFPYNKGGEYRKWYGNQDFVVNWENDGYEIKNFKNKNGKLKSRPQNLTYYFKPCVTWSLTNISAFGARIKDTGFIFDINGMSFFTEEKHLKYVLGLLCSSVGDYFMKINNPSLASQAGDVANVPIIIEEDYYQIINELVEENINISKGDWDSKERSWDYSCSPLIKYGVGKIEEACESWKNEQICNINRLKENEQKLNEIYRKIYQFDSEIEDEPVITLSEDDTETIIKEFIMYAVGCMMGRYSLDKKGLIYAGGVFDSSNYIKYSADRDGIIPISDEEYFDDDIVKRFTDFVEVVFGSEYLDENLEYIASVINPNSTNVKETLRAYFVNDFFKDHCTFYSVTGTGKCPIYWLFDSGKQNGFKCLIYLHRYSQDMVGMIRSDYLTKAQGMIENALRNAEYAISTSSSAVDKAQATKKRDKYIKQLAEIRSYYPALSHIALQRIDLDLDDGVKANYEKFQNIEVSIEGEKKQKVNLLAKI